MSGRKKKANAAAGLPRARKGHARQRQRLIDACISALHLYGPSRTTVEKVVAIAKMSPGIVRFYFNSKAAMLVASLEFLAAEFEEQVLLPVARLKSRPVAALQSLVDLYLDPDIASPRKVSVWYAFWGEASSRQEYFDICGQKDESFARLVRELIEALIAETAQTQLDPDGVALGLIGALEIVWQDIAFQTERDIDRPAAKRRCLSFLRSVFPGQFEASAAPATRPAAAGAAVRFAAWAYDDARLFAMERDALFQSAWAVAGHESQIPRAGDFLTADIGAERALLVRDGAGAVHALRNSCPESPHTLVASRSGRFERSIECRLHGLEFSLAGHSTGSGRNDLNALDLRSVGGLLFVRSPKSKLVGDTERMPDAWFDAGPPQGLMMLEGPSEYAVAADWKIVVEQWLESPTGRAAPELRVPADAEADSLAWSVSPLQHGGWSSRRYAALVECLAAPVWQRRFIAPNQLIDTRPDGLSVLQALPIAPGRCLLRRLDYTVLPPDDSARAAQYLAARLGPSARRSARATAESIQKGMIEFGYQAAAGGPIPAAIAWFQRFLAARVPALARERAPTVA